MRVKYLQQGGAAPAEQAPQGGAPQGGQGGQEAMMQQLMQMAQEIVGQLGPEAAMMLAQAIMELAQGRGGQEMPAPEQQPVYKIGGKMVRSRQ